MLLWLLGEGPGSLSGRRRGYLERGLVGAGQVGRRVSAELVGVVCVDQCGYVKCLQDPQDIVVDAPPPGGAVVS